MDSKTLYDAKEYWNDIKIFFIPRIKLSDKRIEYLIEQIEVSLNTNDTSMFNFDVDKEIEYQCKKYKTFDVINILLVYHFINYIKTENEHYREILQLSLLLHI